LRLHHILLKAHALLQVIEAILLTAYNGSENGWSQLICLLILKAFFVWIMVVFRVSRVITLNPRLTLPNLVGKSQGGDNHARRILSGTN
jgi:hypothetical protein